MTVNPEWTPASKPGIVPLHPLSFGTILGRSFVALRRNPRVLLGFALLFQGTAYLILTVSVAAVTARLSERLFALDAGSFEAAREVRIGTVALIAVITLALTVLLIVTSTIVQAVVVVDVRHAVVAEKLSLPQNWVQVRPALRRLLGYAGLQLAVTALIGGIIVGLAVILTTTLGSAYLALLLLLIPVALVLTFWLTTKLALVIPVLVIEKAAVFPAIARSWRLTRGRFWVVLGTQLIINAILGTIAQLVSIPLSLLSILLASVTAPTGAADLSEGSFTFILLLLLPQVGILLLQVITLVVLSSATGLLYTDCRMRHEGLDLDLLRYVERRDSGQADLPDPYQEGIGRHVQPRPGYGGMPAQPYAAQPTYGPPAPYSAPPAYASPASYSAPPTYDAPTPYSSPQYPPTQYPPPPYQAAPNQDEQQYPPPYPASGPETAQPAASAEPASPTGPAASAEPAEPTHEDEGTPRPPAPPT